MAGRPPIFDRAEQRKNQVVVPMREREKDTIHAEALRLGLSDAAFMRFLAAMYFEKANNNDKAKEV